MKVTSYTLAATAAVVLHFFYMGCTADQLREPPAIPGCEDQVIGFDADIYEIVQNTCAYSGCHLDSAPGTYDTYAGLKLALESGKFYERVVTLRDDPFLGMPPDNAPDGRPRDLTEAELQLIQCWLEKGFPE